MIKFEFENNQLFVENNAVKRVITFENSVPVRTSIENKKSGYVWHGKDDEVIHIPGIDLSGSKLEIEDTSVVFKTEKHTVKWIFYISENTPFIETQIAIKGEPKKVTVTRATGVSTGVETLGAEVAEWEYIEALGTTSKVVDLRATAFFDNTDFTDNLIIETTVPLYHLWASREYDGHIFTLTEKMNREICVIIKNAPCKIAHLNRVYSDLKPEPLETMHVCGSGINLAKIREDEYTYGYTVGMTLCADGEADGLIKAYYEKDMSDEGTYMISNTWGGCHSDSRVCEEFLLKEVDVAKKLGIDAVQIDDGWEKGKTKTSCRGSGEDKPWSSGFRSADPEFWVSDPERFPRGVEYIAEYAKQRGLEMGLWFSPDLEGDYDNWELDLEQMFELNSKYGVKYFKLDGMNIDSMRTQQNITKLLTSLKERSNGEIRFNMDQTGGRRYGYFINRGLGQVFIENRYTYHASYHPHATLRNVWRLSKYFPSRRFLFEVLNQKENADRYEPDDILAPKYYDIDYCFAAVMPSNPLLWMELSELDDGQVETLARIIKVYKEHRENFGDVSPVLDMPDGFSQTGFEIKGKDGTGYVILFRELTEKSEFPYELKEILATNVPDMKTGKAVINKKLGYVFAKI